MRRSILRLENGHVETLEALRSDVLHQRGVLNPCPVSFEVLMDDYMAFTPATSQ